MTGKTCDTCSGDGILIDMGYFHYEIPDGAIPVQRCDMCSVFEGDREAAAAAVDRTEGTPYIGWHHDPSRPYDEIASAGDVWITSRPEDAGPLDLEEEDE